MFYWTSLNHYFILNLKPPIPSSNYISFISYPFTFFIFSCLLSMLWFKVELELSLTKTGKILSSNYLCSVVLIFWIVHFCFTASKFLQTFNGKIKCSLKSFKLNTDAIILLSYCHFLNGKQDKSFNYFQLFSLWIHTFYLLLI